MATNTDWQLPPDRLRELIENYRRTFPGGPMPTENDRRLITPAER